MPALEVILTMRELRAVGTALLAALAELNALPAIVDA